jgi:metal transporter CNNM
MANAARYNMGSIRPAVIGMGRVFGASLTAVSAFPVDTKGHHDAGEEGGSSLWVLAVASMVLVLLGGAFAGLTIAQVPLPLGDSRRMLTSPV